MNSESQQQESKDEQKEWLNDLTNDQRDFIREFISNRCNEQFQKMKPDLDPKENYKFDMNMTVVLDRCDPIKYVWVKFNMLIPDEETTKANKKDIPCQRCIDAGDEVCTCDNFFIQVHAVKVYREADDYLDKLSEMKRNGKLHYESGEAQK